jgi:ribonuclease E
MQETIDHTGTAVAADVLADAAAKAAAWAGEPFLHEGEDPATILAPGTARRRALDDAHEEIAAGGRTPSPQWKVRYALMLGLERVLTEKPPHLADGTELRRHQIDALAGMLTELIAAAQRQSEDDTNGHSEPADEIEDEDEDDEETHLDHENDEAHDRHREIEEELSVAEDAGAVRRYRFRHPTASGKTIAASGFVEAARTNGVLILTHRRLLVDQFRRELTDHGYRDRIAPEVLTGQTVRKPNLITIQTYAWFARHSDEINRDAYQLVICDEAHTALGEKTSAAIRGFPEPVYIGMTATEQLIAKQVSDVFPASVDDLPLSDAARRGLIAPLRSLRVPPVAAIHNVPIIGGDFDEGALAAALDHQALNLAAASLYKERFDSTPGVVYAAGVEHAYNLATEFRAVGLKAEAVSGRTPPVKLAEILAGYERGEIDILINAMLLAEGWNSPRATVVMHLAPTASKRVYQQRIGRIMRTHPRKEAGICVDFVPKGATHNERVVSLHSLLDSDFYREGARVTPAPRRRTQRRARRRLTPASLLVPVTPDVRRRLAVIQREWQRVDPKYLDQEEQEFWGRTAGRNARFEERAELVKKFTEAGASKTALETFLSTCAAENPNRRLRLMALADRVSMPIESADFDILVDLVTQGATWDKERATGARTMLNAIAESRPRAAEQILARWTWRLARSTRKLQDRRASGEFPDAKKLLGAVANSRGHRHEENVERLIAASLTSPREVGAALLASAEGYTPRAQKLIEQAKERLGTIQEIAAALAENLPAPKTQPTRSRRRRRRKRKGPDSATPNGSQPTEGEATDGEQEAVTAEDGNPEPETAATTSLKTDGTLDEPAAKPRRRRRRRKPAAAIAEVATQAESPKPAEPDESAA